ncbi:MAG TPA: hypothetical protein VHY56_09260 [Candidatus Binataceae bacterium]|nr:hypothetical protein [Candidatus Binataceae bacterium]
MAESVPELESEVKEARRELTQTVAELSDKVAATRAGLYPPSVTIAVVIAAGLGFIIGHRRDQMMVAPLPIAAAGYCMVKIFRARRAP